MIIRTCIHNVFAMKNAINRTFFKEKAKIDSYSVKRTFEEEKQDLAIFHAKVNIKNL